MVDWSIYWFVEWLIAWLIGQWIALRLIVWLIDSWLFLWLIDWLIDWLCTTCHFSLFLQATCAFNLQCQLHGEPRDSPLSWKGSDEGPEWSGGTGQCAEAAASSTEFQHDGAAFVPGWIGLLFLARALSLRLHPSHHAINLWYRWAMKREFFSPKCNFLSKTKFSSSTTN